MIYTGAYTELFIYSPGYLGAGDYPVPVLVMVQQSWLYSNELVGIEPEEVYY